MYIGCVDVNIDFKNKNSLMSSDVGELIFSNKRSESGILKKVCCSVSPNANRK